MSNGQLLLTIALLAIATALTRFVPFWLFGKMKKPPHIIDYLARMLPAAMMGLLVVYCFRGMDFTDTKVLAPTLVACVSVAMMHLWKRNTIASIAVGTAVYMIFIRLV